VGGTEVLCGGLDIPDNRPRVAEGGRLVLSSGLWGEPGCRRAGGDVSAQAGFSSRRGRPICSEFRSAIEAGGGVLTDSGAKFEVIALKFGFSNRDNAVLADETHDEVC